MSDALVYIEWIKTYRVWTDPKLGLHALIARGKYDEVDHSPNYSKKLLAAISDVRDTDVHHIYLVKFIYPKTKGEVTERLRALGLGFCGLRHFLTFGAEYPDVQQQIHVETFIDDIHAYLWNHRGKRRLDIRGGTGLSSDEKCFAAVLL